MASKPGPLYHFPWHGMGSYGKYALYVPVAAAALLCDDSDRWMAHMCVLTAVRYALNLAFLSASRIHAISGKHRIQSKGMEFEQMDREDNWDDFLILQVLSMTAVHWVLPGFNSFPAVHWVGLLQLLLLHVGPTEFVYYWFHRALHHHSLYKGYHQHHHSSFVTEPTSGSCHPFLEHIGYTANFAIPMVGTWMLGGCSIAMFYAYTIGFDLLNCIGHCNWEFVPVRLYQSVPFLKYLVYTPCYHSLHHSRVHTNFCLFMPLYDYLGGTLEMERDGVTWTSDKLHAETMAKDYESPQAVFLAHGTDLLSTFHLPFFLRGLSKDPYVESWALYPLLPLATAACAAMWAFGSAFVSHVERVAGRPVQTWVTPRYGFQFFLKWELPRINRLIADAVCRADRQGVRVFGLGALNKAEHVNGGGAKILEALPEAVRERISLVHGNTLTAACIANELAEGTEEVFLTGATSKLGRALSLWLCRKGVRVTMMTTSDERFEAIRTEAAPEHRHLLTQARRYEEGAGCRTWIVGKLMSAADQRHAPAGAHFHQFVVPPVEPARADCSYGELAAMGLPDSARDIKACELFMPRRQVFACHAGALVHLLEGWQHHEVGAIDVDRIGAVWEAALKHGFKPVVGVMPNKAAARAAAKGGVAAAKGPAAAVAGGKRSPAAVAAA